MHEAMKEIRAQLGNDAVILNSKQIETGGFLGFFTKKQIEVIAAISPPVTKQPRPIRKQTNIDRESVYERAIPSPKSQTKIEEPSQQQLLQEINQLKELVQGITSQGKSKEEYPEPFQKMDNRLKAQGVTDAIRLQVMTDLMKKWNKRSLEERTEAAVTQDLYHHLQRLLTQFDMGGLSFDKKVVNIVGPTGVGKTTTIAKLSAHCVLKKQKKVALITTDTYRIAAVEQLRTYAKILKIPLEVVYTIEDFRKAIQQFKNYDLILVDSAGRNFRNKLYVEELSKIIDFEHDASTYLILSLTSKFEDMKNIINQFDLIPIHQVILTKQDETSTNGAMLNIPLELKKGIAYVTTGQNVPDDIVQASIPYLLDQVLEVKSGE